MTASEKDDGPDSPRYNSGLIGRPKNSVTRVINRLYELKSRSITDDKDKIAGIESKTSHWKNQKGQRNLQNS